MIAKLLSAPGAKPRHYTTIMHSISLIESRLADPVSAPKFGEVIQRIRAGYHTEHEQRESGPATAGRDNALRILAIQRRVS